MAPPALPRHCRSTVWLVTLGLGLVGKGSTHLTVVVGTRFAAVESTLARGEDMCASWSGEDASTSITCRRPQTLGPLRSSLLAELRECYRSSAKSEFASVLAKPGISVADQPRRGTGRPEISGLLSQKNGGIPASHHSSLPPAPFVDWSHYGRRPRRAVQPARRHGPR